MSGSGSGRAVAFLREAPPGFARAVAEAREARLYLVQETGPTSFVLKEEVSPSSSLPSSSSPGAEEESRVWRKPKVMIGERHVCSSCRGAGATRGGDGGSPCRHILFVVLKVLRVPEANPIAWQHGLREAEIQEALRCRRTTLAPNGAAAAAAAAAAEAAAAAAASASTSASAASSAHGGARRPVAVGDDDCPICQEHVVPRGGDLDELEVVGVSARAEAGEAEGALVVQLADDDVDRIVYCTRGCKCNMHRRCMGIWCGHQASTGKAATCPLCRCEWDAEQAEALVRPRAAPPAKRDVRARRRRARATLLQLAGIDEDGKALAAAEDGTDDIAAGDAVAAGDDARGGEPAGAPHPGVRCRGCGACPVLGPRYVCCACSLDTTSYDLCGTCFCHGQYHRDRHHPFMRIDAPGDETLPVDRPAPRAAEQASQKAAAPEGGGRKKPTAQAAPAPAQAKAPASLYLPDLDGLELGDPSDVLVVGGVSVASLGGGGRSVVSPSPAPAPAPAPAPPAAAAAAAASRAFKGRIHASSTSAAAARAAAAAGGRSLSAAPSGSLALTLGAGAGGAPAARPAPRRPATVARARPATSAADVAAGGVRDLGGEDLGLFIGSAAGPKPEPHMPRLAGGGSGGSGGSERRRRGFAPLHPPSFRPPA